MRKHSGHAGTVQIGPPIVPPDAIGGGIAAIYYLEPYETNDIDVFFSPMIVGQHGLVSLDPVYNYLQALGYEAVKEGVMIESWLVQFVPAFASIQEEAIAQARQVTYVNSQTFVFGPEHLAAELLRSGRRKDQLRVIALIEAGKVDMPTFRAILTRHGLSDKWKELATKFDLAE